MKIVILAMCLFGLIHLSSANAQAFEWQELGETTYGMCSGCHGAEGAGIPGVFPPPAGYWPTIITKDGGRAYLINTLLYGLSGEITVLGKTYNGLMPSWESLSDEQVAAVLNYSLHTWGNDTLLPEDFGPILPEDVAEARGADLSTEDVLELRNTLNLRTDE